MAIGGPKTEYNKGMKPMSAIVLMAALSGPTMAGVAGAQATALNYPSQVIPGQRVTGPVTNIDTVNQLVQLKDPDGLIQTFKISPEVQIQRNGNPISLRNVNLGDVVTVSLK